jgi:murein DD-endopeptidase MepM/ murein hydrolase activator NlpD
MQTRLKISSFWTLILLSLNVFGVNNGDHTSDSTSAKEVLKQKSVSVISQMTDEQLITLIDLLFEMDSIPVDMVKEISKTVQERHKRDSLAAYNVITNCSAPELSVDNFPAKDIYTVFDSRLVHPKDDLWQKTDTSFIIDLLPKQNPDFYMPVCGVITSQFGWRDSAQHNGIDIDLNKGDPVVSAFDGMVRYAGRQGGYGNVIVVRHYNGLETYYAHLWKIKVKPGQVVLAGQLIGLGGSSGHSTGSHLHFETRFKGVPINPKYFISFPNETLVGTKILIRKTRYGMCAYPIDANKYTIEKGDNIYEVAKRFGTTTKTICSLNGVEGRWMKLKPGMIIKVGSNQ